MDWSLITGAVLVGAGFLAGAWFERSTGHRELDLLNHVWPFARGLADGERTAKTKGSKS